MLTAIRARTGSLIVKLLFILLIAAFAIWGIGDIFRRVQQKSDPILAIGKDYRYEVLDFEHDLRLAVQRLSRQQGVQLNAAQLTELGLDKQLVDQAERRGLMLEFGERLGLRLPQVAAVATIQADPAFAGADGRFDRARFDYALQQTGLSEAAYVAQRQIDLRGDIILRSALSSTVSPDPLTRNIHAWLTEERTAETLRIPLASILDIATPDEAALRQYQKEHEAEFMAPEYRSAAILHMSPADFVAGIAVDEAEIARDYEQRRAEFSTPELRDVEQAVVQDKALAERLAASNAADFAETVKEAIGGDPVQLGEVSREKLPPEIADAVFTLREGGISAPLPSPFGLHVVHVKSIKPASTRSLEEVKEQLKTELALARAADAMESARAQLEDELAGGAGIAEAGAKLGLKVQEIAALDPYGMDAEGRDLGLAEEIVRLVYETEAGAPASVTGLSDGSYVLVEVKGITPPAPKPFEKVKEEVTADWRAARQMEKALAEAQAIADKLKAGGDLKAAAAALGLGIKVSKPFRRNKGDAEADIDADLARQAFDLEIGETVTGSSMDGPILLRLTGILPADPAQRKDEFAAVADKVAESLRNDLGLAFYQALAREIGLERNDAVWQAIMQQQRQGQP